MIPKIANVNPSQVVDILNKTGNCISASIPMGIHQLISKYENAKKEAKYFYVWNFCRVFYWLFTLQAWLV